MTALVVGLALLLPIIAGLSVWLGVHLNAASPLRPDYRTYDLRRMETWGYRGDWTGPGVARIVGPTPRVGDVVVGHADDVHVIHDVTVTMRSGLPTDETFVNTRPWRRRQNLAWRLPPRQRDGDPERGDFL